MSKFSENNTPWLTMVQQQAQPGQPAAGLFRLFLSAATKLQLIDSTGTVVNAAADGTNGTNGTDGIDGMPGMDGTNGTNGTNGVGVPAGGAINQILKKNSDTDYDTGWENPPDTGLADAPEDGNTYARQNGAWEEIAGGSGLSGGTAGQILQKYDDGNGDYGWRTLPGGGGTSQSQIWDQSVGVPALSEFTQIDPTHCCTFSENAGKALSIQITSASPTTTNILGLTKAAPAAPYTLSALVIYNCPAVPYNGIAFGWFDPVTGRYDIGVFSRYNWNAGQAFESQTYSSTTDRTNVSTTGTVPLYFGPTWLHLTDDGTNVYWGYSFDGYSIIPICNHVKATSYLAGAYTNLFMGIFPDGETGNSFINTSLNILVWDEDGEVRSVANVG